MIGQGEQERGSAVAGHGLERADGVERAIFPELEERVLEGWEEVSAGEIGGGVCGGAVGVSEGGPDESVSAIGGGFALAHGDGEGVEDGGSHLGFCGHGEELLEIVFGTESADEGDDVLDAVAGDLAFSDECEESADGLGAIGGFEGEGDVSDVAAEGDFTFLEGREPCVG